MKGLDFSALRGAVLGPMAGVADAAMRTLCAGYGAGFTVTEMVSSKALCFQDKKSRELMSITPAQRPCGIQLFGDNPEYMARAAAIAAEYEPDFIDINMGCPVPKVAGTGSGAALMRNPALAQEIARATVNAVDIPVTAKIRSGWDSDSINAVEMAKRLEAAGVAAVTVHGRTKAQGYAPPVNREIIAEVRRAVSIPVIANGGVYAAQDAPEMLRQTGCDAVMIAQGALGNPFIFQQIAAALRGESIPVLTVSRRMEDMLRQCRLICENRGERRGILDMRKHAGWYIRGVDGAAEYRRRAVAASDYAAFEAIASEILSNCKGN